jgi:uncharacterized protein (DUF1800 family)
LLTACGGGSGNSASSGAVSSVAATSEPTPASDPAATPIFTEADAVRFLNQATFGSTESETAVVQQTKRQGWMESQYATAVAETHFDRVQRIGEALFADRLAIGVVPAQVLDYTIWEAYLSAPDQLRKRMGYNLSQIMPVSREGFPNPSGVKLSAGYLDVLERNAFGNFRQLLEEVSLSPAMGYYLSHRNNRKADYPGGDTTKPPLRVPDENYAREIMQLFTIGTSVLNNDGTVKLVNGKLVETYGEEDVRGLARVFTGWRWDVGQPDWQRAPMVCNNGVHSPEEKKFLGITIPANTNCINSLRIALDTLFNHPNTPPFISKQLIQRLVTSNPSPAYVTRVANRFANNGAGVRGDLKAVLDAILRDPEAEKPGTSAVALTKSGKLREPVLRYTTFARAFGAAKPAADKAWLVGDLSNPAAGLGQSPLHSPSIFNFYRPGYVPPNTPIAAQGLVAPEFQITTDTSIPGYINFMQKQLTNPDGGLVMNYAPELALATNPTALVDRLNRRLTHSAMSAATRDEIIATVTALPAGTAAQNLTRVRTAILLTVASPEFIAQK